MQFDSIIHSGAVVDGTGRCEPFRSDVGVVGDQIAAVGKLDDAQAKDRIDASGQIVCPGFIDVHVHSEISLLGGRDQLASVYQGVTTHLTAPDGFGWAPLPPERAQDMWRYTQFAYGEVDLPLNWRTTADYLRIFEGRIPANVYPQIPHCAVRLAAMGWEARPATDEELDAMTRITREWLEAGAVCLCLGLDYQPSVNADLRELVALSKVAASYGAIYAAHIRYQTLGRKRAWEETIELARQAEIPVHISHERVDDEISGLLERIDREGIDLTFESYLYPAGMTHVTMMLPVDFQAGGPETVLENLKRPHIKKRALPHLRGKLGEAGNQIIGYTKSGRFVGMKIAEAAARAGKSCEEFAFDLLLEEDGVETLIFPWFTAPQENDVILNQTVLHPRMMIASDGIYNVPHPHPRSYGCFAQTLRKFMRERKLLSLQEAIYKVSGFPAQRFGLKGRGQIAEGYAADLVIFDPETIADRATWERPIQRAVGVSWVLVNGVPVIADGTPTGNLPGRVLRR